MKKQNFLNKLKKQGKLELVESSEEIKESYIKKSESSLISAKILLENNRLEESIALTYYSMYHILTALLFKTGIKSENHSASIILLKDIFNIENKEILEAKKERIDKQYYVDFYTTKQETKEAIETAEDFNNKIRDFLDKLTNNQIQEFRDKFKVLKNSLI